MSTFVRIYAFFLIFSALAYSFWYNLLGAFGTGILLISLSLITTIAYILWRRDPRSPRTKFSWRGQPWLIIGYAVFAAVSLIWSSWPIATAVTWCLLILFTVHGILLVRVFRKSELLEIVERVLATILLLSLLLEFWVGVVLQHPILPNFSDAPADPNPQWYWVRGNLLDDLLVGDRIQGIVGNANLIAVLCVLALIVFAAQRARKARFAGVRWAFILLALWLCLRAGSATMFVTLAAVAAAAVIVVIFRRFSSRRARTALYLSVAVVFLAAVTTLIVAKDALLSALGRSSDITGRTEIWGQVLTRAQTSPVFGNGYASPWLPWDPAFDGWILDHGITVFHAHNMWLDVFLQLGAIGVLLLLSIYAITGWRAWQLAIHSDRSVRSMTPLLLVLTLVIQGLTESAPLMFWGWMLITVLYTALMPTAKKALMPARAGASQGH